MDRIYLDNASTTTVDSTVIDKIRPYLEEHYGNASSIHSFGQQTKHILEESRETIAKEIGAKPSEIYFTSGGTESDNFAIKGTMFAQLGKRNHIISSKLEHKAVLESLEWLKQKFGIEVDYVNHDSKGKLDLDDLKSKIRPSQTALISIMHANNELGNINPISEIAALAKPYGISVHTDAVQSAGKLKLNVDLLGIDLLAISGHKFHAPKGVGMIYIRTGTRIESLVHGGTHERNLRAGTENFAFALGLATALKLANEQSDKTAEHCATLKELFLAELIRHEIDFSRNCDCEHSLPQILNLKFNFDSRKKLASDVLLLGLDSEGVAVSSGSACTSGTAKPSHVLLSLGLSDEEARASVRISFSKFNTSDEVKRAASKFATVLNRLAPKTMNYIG